MSDTDHFCFEGMELKTDCSHCLRAEVERLKAEIGRMQKTVRDVLNRMGGPVMTYSSENEVDEWHQRWAMSGIELINILTPP